VSFRKKIQSIFFLIFVFLFFSPLFLISQEAGNFPVFDEYLSLVNRGEEAKLCGDFDLSIPCFEEALALAQKKKDSVPDQVQVLYELGLLYWNIGQIDPSTKSFQQALSLTNEKIPDAGEKLLYSVEISKFYQEGKHFRNQSQYEDSKNSFMQAVVLAQTINSREHLVKCFRQLGVTYWEMNEADEFYKTTKQALELKKEDVPTTSDFISMISMIILKP
jgi:tetratricopeptide (TPR) repeat protein